MINSHTQDLSGDEKKIAITEMIEEVKGKSTRETDRILREKNHSKPLKVNLRLEASTLDKLNEVKALKAHSIKDMDDLILMMSAEVMKQWDPAFVARKTRVAHGKSRYVAVNVRNEVKTRDQGQCRNCGSTYAIQIDHIKPYSHGGKTVTSNLQLLCRNCNQRKSNKRENAMFSR